jgi:phosphoribosylamine--glycine ligase
VCARGENLARARERAYAAVEAVRFEGMHFRRDIGARGMKAAP